MAIYINEIPDPKKFISNSFLKNSGSQRKLIANYSESG